jgi:hypothetical protein
MPPDVDGPSVARRLTIVKTRGKGSPMLRVPAARFIE